MMLTIEIHIKYTWSFLHVGGFLHLCVLYYLEEHPLYDLANILQRKIKAIRETKSEWATSLERKVIHLGNILSKTWAVSSKPI